MHVTFMYPLFGERPGHFYKAIIDKQTEIK